MTYYVYILKSLKDNRFYIGSTKDVQKRLDKHNRGGTISTKNRRPFELVYQEAYTTKVDALKRERQIKSYKGGVMFKKLLENA